jgi:hypothetical protein
MPCSQTDCNTPSPGWKTKGWISWTHNGIWHLVTGARQFYNSFIGVGGNQGGWEANLQLDDHMRNLLRELGHAINDTVADSERITGAISNVRSAGYEIVLKLDATIGLVKRETQSARLSTQDRRFLESIHIQVDPELIEEEGAAPKFDLTPQDIRFLKSLKISLEDAL